ncbi:PcfJ domain-containing protein [Marinicella sp. W31]|uniref:PcfJ domain-containing protein n=1 Tax=Marinicella sp. W31 TaxID=3023713 RepID=UPI003756637C
MLDRLKIRSELEIELDNTKLEFRVGKFSLPVVNVKKVPEKVIELKSKILQRNDYDQCPDPSIKDGYKEIHKYFYSILGPRFNENLSRVCFNHWIKPNRETIFKYFLQSKYSCPHTGYYKSLFLNNDQVRRYYNHQKLMQEVINDKLHNIVPLVAYFALSPCELKKKFGKGLWKRITKKSLYFNRSLIAHLDYIYPETARLNSIKNVDKCINTISVLTSIKATLVCEYNNWFNPSIYGSDFEFIFNLLEWLSKCKVTCKSSLYTNKYTYIDTLRMAGRFGVEFNKNWSVNRVYREHERLTQISNANYYPDIVYPWLQKHEDLLSNKEFEGFTVRFVLTPYQLKNEGIEMHHCVSSYDYEISDKRYLVFSLRNTKINKRSTLGLFYDYHGKKWSVDQHLGVCNQSIVDRGFKEIENQILKIVNSKIHM